LIYLRGSNDRRGQWLPLNKCIWSRSVLRSKYALMPTLNDYRALIRDTLEVPNVTADMLVGELLNITSDANATRIDDRFQYSKDLLHDINRMQLTDTALQRLNHAKCWPCLSPSLEEEMFCSIGNFYVNDRQDLFEIFQDYFPFLGFNFATSKAMTKLLRSRGCVSFLSSQVTVKREACQPLEFDNELTRDYKERADALNKYAIPIFLS